MIGPSDASNSGRTSVANGWRENRCFFSLTSPDDGCHALWSGSGFFFSHIYIYINFFKNAIIRIGARMHGNS